MDERCRKGFDYFKLLHAANDSHQAQTRPLSAADFHKTTCLQEKTQA
jgi:hypothetical protein